MDTAIATVCLSGGLNEKLQAIADAGFKFVELFENDLLSFNGTPDDVRQILEGLDLKAATFQPFRDFEGMPDARRARVFQRAERKFDVMNELGCNLLMICSNVSPESLGGIDRASADLHELGERAAARGMRVGFEALSWGRHIFDYRDAWEVVRRADHPNVGLVLDSFHILARKTDLQTIRSIPRDRIFLVQMADAPPLDMDYLSWSRHYRSFPGQGDLPIDNFMDALLATGYDGLLSLEIFNDQFRAGSARSVAVDGRRSLIYMLDRLRAQTNVQRSQPPLPARSRCLGTEFIEFAIDDESAVELESLLAGLGFSKVGEHVSKSVTRWNQGQINIVVNTEKEGFAHSFNIVHGTSVCAIALRVEDATATLDRAQALLEEPFRQAVGPGELEIPAVRGLGGSLIYFTDPKSELARVWDVDFAQLSGNSRHAVAGLIAIDHISQTMLYVEMLSWLLFYKSLLDVSSLPEQDVLDPGGLVKSQVLRSDDGALRLILNASQSVQTLSSRFLAEAFGSGVQHVAFSSSNIFATARALHANGVGVLPIAENYYRDLEAKTDLPAETIDQLRSLNILYEREGEAEYFQLYTRTFANRFFFEIVERRGGYQGFGASNAQIRLAAQARLNPISVD
jgi:4-hydroxyphenylpyruvate dioxygenase